MNATTYDQSRILGLLGKDAPEEITAEEFKELRAWLTELDAASANRRDQNGSRQFLIDRFRHHLDNQGITKGLIAELGGPFTTIAPAFPEFDFEYLSLYPVEGRSDVLVADITQCDYVPSERYDAVFSISVLEHVSKPWLAAEQITRILKPGGITFHSVPFSYFYHGSPADYWRVTPDALRLLFSELMTLEGDFLGQGRRRDNRGSDYCPVDRDGGEPFAVDAFGGWRENWHTIYCGKKDDQYASDALETARHQAIINLVKSATVAGLTDDEAVRLVQAGIKDFEVSIDDELIPTVPGTGIRVAIDDVDTLWKMRGGKYPRPSGTRWVQWRVFDGDARLADLQADGPPTTEPSAES